MGRWGKRGIAYLFPTPLSQRSPIVLPPFPPSVPSRDRIVQAREDKAIRTTQQLAAVIGQTKLFRSGGKGGGGGKGAGGGGGGRGPHPATRTFQALRIAVNDELQKLEKVRRVQDGAAIPCGTRYAKGSLPASWPAWGGDRRGRVVAVQVSRPG